jgi:hypothetical protein
MNKGIINYIIIFFVLVVTCVLLYKIITYQQTPVEVIIDRSAEHLTRPLPEIKTGEEPLSQERIPQRFACVGEFCDGSGETDDPSKRTTTKVMIPLVKEGGDIGCGVDIFYAPHTVPKTLSVLDASFRLLFDIKARPEIEADGFWNTVASYPQLQYKNVFIENDVVKINLIGSLYGPGHCSLPELREQILRTALYYENIKEVEVYLNGKIYDWCEQDQSDGEGPCPETPDYWRIKR